MKKIISFLTITSIMALIMSAFLTVEVGFADMFDALFEEDQAGVSFVDYSGELGTLESEGYDPGLVQTDNFRDYIITVVNFFLGFLGLVSVIIVIYGGVLYVTAAGDEEKTQKGKKSILYAVIGILIILGSYAFVNTLISNLADDDGKSYLSCSEDNEEFKEWVAAGNTPG